MPGHRVCAVIVTYRYPHEKLLPLISSIRGQVDHVCLVDNNDSKTTNAGFLEFGNANCTVISNKANLGLAKAINQGIRFAIKNDCVYVLLLDQDSRPVPDMIEKLVAARNDPSIQGQKVAAVGPVVIDQHQGKPLPFLRFKPTRIQKISPPFNGETLISVDFLISSGMLLNTEALQKEGLMDESLFIDNIDLEWCFRVKKAGYHMYGVRDALLYHRLGDNAVRIPIINRFVLLHQPERQYYIMRNRILLYRRAYIPFYWKLQDFFRLLFKLFFFSVAVSPRLQNLHMMIRGILTGLSKRK